MSIYNPYDLLNSNYNRNNCRNDFSCEKIRNLRTVAAEINGGRLYLLLNKVLFSNAERFGLIICQNVPKTSLPVSISVGIGPGALSYPLLTTAGLPVLAYQLPCRKRLPITVNSAGAFYIDASCLCHTGPILPVGPVIPVSVGTIEVNETSEDKKVEDVTKTKEAK